MSTKSIVAANDILRAKHRVEIVPRGRGFVFHHMDPHILEQDKAVREYAHGKKTADLTVEELVLYGEQFASIKTGKEPVTTNIALANISLKEHGVEIRKTGRTFVYAHIDPEHEARHPAQNLRVYIGENASINGIRPVELIAHGVEFVDSLPDESPVQGGSTADLKYKIETTEVEAGWNDSGFRHRVVCSDGRVSRWAPYSVISFLDDCASVPPYFTDGNDNKIMTVREAFALVAYGEETQTVAQPGTQSAVEMEAVDEATPTELSEHPTALVFRNMNGTRAGSFEFGWMWGGSAVDKQLNVLAEPDRFGKLTDAGSLVLPVHEYLLILDDTNHYWGTGKTIEQAITAMPNNMDTLPNNCCIYTSPAPMTVNENGCVRGTGKHIPVQIMSKLGKTIRPVMPK
jgi:hypothetical protein